MELPPHMKEIDLSSADKLVENVASAMCLRQEVACDMCTLSTGLLLSIVFQPENVPLIHNLLKELHASNN